MKPDPLAELRDIALPDAVGIWPPAVGWWLLAIIVILMLVMSVFFIRKYSSDRRWKKSAMLELMELRKKQNQGEEHYKLLADCSILFRRVALYIDNREEVAAVNGQKWLEKLDQLNNSTDFTQGAGQILGEGVWKKPESMLSVELSPVIDLLERFIKGAKVQHD